MSFSNDGTTWGPWQPYATLSNWTLSSGAGPKTVYARVRDSALNQSSVATASMCWVRRGATRGVALGGGAVFANVTAVPIALSGPPGHDGDAGADRPGASARVK